MSTNAGSLVASEEPEEFLQLTAQEKLFAARYLENFNILSAAKSVSLKQLEANALFKRPLFRRYVQHLTDELTEVSMINKALVEHYMLSLIPKVTGEEPVSLVDRGEEFTARKFDGPAAIRLGSELSKIAGMQESGGGISINLNFGNLGIPEGTIVDGKVINHDG